MSMTQNPLTVAEYVAEARWLSMVARTLRKNGGELHADMRERESKAYMRAARLAKQGKRVVWVDSLSVVGL